MGLKRVHVEFIMKYFLYNSVAFKNIVYVKIVSVCVASYIKKPAKHL